MNRYYMDWPYEQVVEDESGEWCKYSDVAALESQLQQAQAENDVLRNFFNVMPKEKEAEKAAESLLKHFKHWGCGHSNAGVCSECYAALLQELEALRTVKAKAQAIISHIDAECDGECQGFEYMKLEQKLRNALVAARGAD